MKSVLKRGVLLATVLVGGAMVAAPGVAGAAPQAADHEGQGRGHGEDRQEGPEHRLRARAVPLHREGPDQRPVAPLGLGEAERSRGRRTRRSRPRAPAAAAVAKRWSDSHRNPVVCDGKTHTSRFTVDQVEGKAGLYGTLVKGKAWVQFCLFDDTTPKGDGQTDFGQPVSSMVWKNIH